MARRTRRDVDPAAVGAGRETVVDVQAVRGPVRLHVGDVLRLEVAEPAATGYRWTAATPEGGLLDPLESSVAAQAGAPPGAQARRTFRFLARRPGSATVDLLLARPWEQGRAADRVAVDVHVLPPESPAVS